MVLVGTWTLGGDGLVGQHRWRRPGAFRPVLAVVLCAEQDPGAAQIRVRGIVWVSLAEHIFMGDLLLLARKRQIQGFVLGGSSLRPIMCLPGRASTFYVCASNMLLLRTLAPFQFLTHLESRACSLKFGRSITMSWVAVPSASMAASSDWLPSRCPFWPPGPVGSRHLLCLI